MLLSMTGYGNAKDDYQGRSYTVDIRTLNGKMSDLRLKAPAYLRSKEVVLRKIIMDRVIRGKMDCTITVLDNEVDADYKLNVSLIESYLNQLKNLADKHQLDHPDFLQTIIRIPNVIQANDEVIAKEEYDFVLRLLDNAIADLNTFRAKEGVSLLQDLNKRVDAIKNHLAKVGPLEEIRQKELLSRIRKSIQDHLQGEQLDENRLEQEMIYYIEKLDIHEEKVRLTQHCAYFLDTAQNELPDSGKKLNFISQEMGREINTLGSKAQFSPLQQLVVEMKVELDQIKEQLANVL